MSEHGAPPPPPEDPRDAPVVIPGGNRGWGPPPPGWATPPAGIHPAAPDATGGTPAGPVPSDGPGAGKPGVAPLRPLRFADLLDATFATVRRAPLPTVAQAVVVQLVPALLSLFLAYRLDASIVALESTLGRLAAAPDPAGWGPILSSGLLVHPWQSYAWAGTALLAVQLMANALIAGPSTVAGMRAVLGMGTGWGAALALCAGPMVRMLLWNLCLLVAAVLLLGLLAAGALLVAAALGALAAVALSLATGLVLLPLLLWVGIRLCLVPTLLVTRKAGIGGAVRESVEAVRRFLVEDPGDHAGGLGGAGHARRAGHAAGLVHRRRVGGGRCPAGCGTCRGHRGQCARRRPGHGADPADAGDAAGGSADPPRTPGPGAGGRGARIPTRTRSRGAAHRGPRPSTRTWFSASA